MIQSLSEDTDLGLLERYRDLLGDAWDAFAEATRRPHRATIWTNLRRTTPEALAEWLTEDGFDLEPIPWHPGGFRLGEGQRPGYSLAYFLGLYHVQEETSMMPITLLDPQPGERILDLCAAPGNKTAQIAARQLCRGSILACDLDRDRLGTIRRTAHRLGLTNISVAQADASNLPPRIGLFDRVLADVPCSCEGTARKNPKVIHRLRDPLWRQAGQIALLSKAAQLAKPGGRIVYSTCTYAPEENECVVDTVLRKFSTKYLRLAPARIPGVHSAPGLQSWQGQDFVPGMEGTMRVYPHLNDTGGFFVAVLERGEEINGRVAESLEPRQAVDEVIEPLDMDEHKTFLEERFGVSRKVFDDVHLYRRNSKSYAFIAKDLDQPQAPTAVPAGVPIFRTKSRSPRLFHSGTVEFLGGATKNVVDLSRAQLQAFIDHGEVDLTPEQEALCNGPGYALLRYGGIVATYVDYDPDEAPGRVRGHVPRPWGRLKTRPDGTSPDGASPDDLDDFDDLDT